MSRCLNPGRGDPGGPPTPALALPTSPGVPGGPGGHLPRLRGVRLRPRSGASLGRVHGALGLDVPQPGRLTLAPPHPEEPVPRATWRPNLQASSTGDPHLFCNNRPLLWRSLLGLCPCHDGAGVQHLRGVRAEGAADTPTARDGKLGCHLEDQVSFARGSAGLGGERPCTGPSRRPCPRISAGTQEHKLGRCPPLPPGPPSSRHTPDSCS